MEKHEFEDDTVPHAILAHQRRELIAKATAIIVEAETKETLCERMQAYYQDFEAWMNYPPPNNMFR